MNAAWRNAHNFSGGPGAMPQVVLDQMAQAMLEVPEVGLSILGISHRSDWFRAVVDEAQQILRALLGAGEDWEVLFLQGGASLQFSMALANLGCGQKTPVDWVRGGYWSAKAMTEAASACAPRCAWDGRATGYSTLPHWGDLDLKSGVLHYISNETVEGVQFHEPPPRDTKRRVVCDMSSDFLSRPIETRAYDVIYAHAQKNIGPAGVTVVLVRKALLDRPSAPGLPPVLDWRVHAKARSIYNTPPVAAIYTMLLVLRWLRDEIGDLERMAHINAAKAAAVYAALDANPDVCIPHAQAAWRSQMNIAFRLADPARDASLRRALTDAGISGLDGHRSLGGFRASLYNAVTLQAAHNLAALLRDWARRC
jgi:phosphoserine aminotransferase